MVDGDVRKWLPVLAGETVESAESSAAFIFDWNRTLGELLAENHYDLATGILHAEGIERYSEAHEERRSFIGDGMMVKRSADVPMCAFWARFRSGFYATLPHMEADIRESASVAHIYGGNICAAESFTTNGRPGKWDGWWAFQCHPGRLKPVADAAMAEGLNKFVIHTSTHQPDDEHIPGPGLNNYGQWFTRHDTWAGEARPWTDYLSRSSFMLRQGRFVADILYFYGEDAALTRRFFIERPAIPSGWNFDYANGDVLLNAVSIGDGALETESGMRYRMLVIDNMVENISEEVAGRIAAISAAGIPVCDLRGSVQLEVPLPLKADREYYPRPDTSTAHPSQKALAMITSALTDNGISPDVKGLPDSCAFVHRKLPRSDIYWITNISSAPREFSVSLRDGKGPVQVWHADSGAIEDAEATVEDGRISVHLKMVRDDAVFVVVGAKVGADRRSGTVEHTKAKAVGGPWTLSFSGMASPGPLAMPSLTPLEKHPGEQVRFFSGTIRYACSFDFEDDPSDAVLSLGRVHDMARVTLNGKDLGLLWKEPFTVDVSGVLRQGSNDLEIKVINSWANRLIGDAALPAAQRLSWTAYEYYSSGDPLPPSGLAGPVEILY